MFIVSTDVRCTCKPLSEGGDRDFEREADCAVHGSGSQAPERFECKTCGEEVFVLATPDETLVLDIYPETVIMLGVDERGHRRASEQTVFVKHEHPNAFEKMLSEKAPEAPWRDRAIEVFGDYGVVYSSELLNVFLHAIDQDKVEEVLKILKEHFEEHLKHQHPDARGHLLSSMGRDPSAEMFIGLYENTLGLQPSS